MQGKRRHPEMKRRAVDHKKARTAVFEASSYELATVVSVWLSKVEWWDVRTLPRKFLAIPL